MSFDPLVGTTEMLPMVLCDTTYKRCVSGSYAPPGQFEPPPAVAIPRVPQGPLALLTTGGVNCGPILYFATSCKACALSSGVKLIKSSILEPCLSKAGGLVGNGCVGEYHSPGTVPFSTGRSSMGQMGWPVARSSTYRNACLLGCATALTVRPFTVKSVRIGGDGLSMSQMPW